MDFNAASKKNIPDMLNYFGKFIEEIKHMSKEASSHNIIDSTSNEIAIEMANQAKEIENAIEKKRKEIKKPYLDITRKLDSDVKTLRDNLSFIQQVLQEKITPWMIENEDKVKTDSCNATIEKKIEYKIIDIKLIPEEIINERFEQIHKALAPAINKRINAGLRKIDGIDIFEKSKLKVSKKNER